MIAKRYFESSNAAIDCCGQGIKTLMPATGKHSSKYFVYSLKCMMTLKTHRCLVSIVVAVLLLAGKKRVLGVVTDIYLRATKVKTRGALHSVCRQFN